MSKPTASTSVQLSLSGRSQPVVACPYCGSKGSLGLFLIKLRGNGFSKKRLKCPHCGKVGERDSKNPKIMLKIEGPAALLQRDADWDDGDDDDYEADQYELGALGDLDESDIDTDDYGDGENED